MTQVNHDAASTVPLNVHPEQKYSMPGEIPNVATLIESVVSRGDGHGGGRPHPAEKIEFGPFQGVYGIPINPLFSIFYLLVIIWIVRKALKHADLIRPSKLQVGVETFLGGLFNFFRNIVGPENERYVPFAIALWLFVLTNNLAVLIPGLKSPDSSYRTTLALALCTFCYVQYHAIRTNGVMGLLKHLAGEPLWLAPLMLPIHVLGELIKPVSLSLRLYGNIFGEDKLLATFLGLGMTLAMAIFGLPFTYVGIPLHLPFFFLVLILSTVQATVFALLSAIYIVLLLPHDEHESHEKVAEAVH